MRRRKCPKQLELLPAVRRRSGEVPPTAPETQREVVQALAELLLAVARGATPANEEVGDEPEAHR